MRFSIVIVCFGGDPSGLLDELGRQREPDDEVIVVDNYAGRGGTARVRDHPQVDLLIEAPENPGFAAAANQGAAAAAGDVLLLINPDAVPAPGCLAALRHPPDEWDAWMGVVTLPGGERVNTAGGEAHFLGFGWVGRLGDPVASLPAKPYSTGFLSGACMAVRLSVWRALGGMPDHFFMYCEDVDLSHRLRLAGHAFGVLPAARVAHEYAFEKGPYKWRNLERNRWTMVVRTYPTSLLALVLPALLAAELPLLAAAAVMGWAPMKLSAWLDVLRWLPRAGVERRAVQSSARISPRAFADALTAALDSPLLGRVGRSKTVCACLSVYWRTVLALLPQRTPASQRSSPSSPTSGTATGERM